MSAFYVGTESLSMLTDIIYRYMVAGFNSFGFDFPREVEEVFYGKTDTEIFNLLSSTNIDALVARYDEDTAKDMIDGKGYEVGHDIWQYRNGIQPWHYQLLKSLNCYVYQCSEGNVPDTPIYKAMDKLSIRLAQFIACHQQEYIDSEWR